MSVTHTQSYTFSSRTQEADLGRPLGDWSQPCLQSKSQNSQDHIERPCPPKNLRVRERRRDRFWLIILACGFRGFCPWSVDYFFGPVANQHSIAGACDRVNCSQDRDQSHGPTVIFENILPKIQDLPQVPPPNGTTEVGLLWMDLWGAENSQYPNSSR